MADSGGYKILEKHGRWTITPQKYSRLAEFWQRTPGKLKRIAIQDWMCEPHIIKKTGLDVITHQRNTVASFIDLSNLSSNVNWMPVIQGYTLDEYLRCIDLYYKARIYLHEFEVVGIGSVCSRQETKEAEQIIRRIAAEGINLHAFGFKIRGIERVGDALYSADSMSWSYDARVSRVRSLQCSEAGHSTCANCLNFASEWFHRNNARLVSPDQ
jgi:hypothetical protein